MVMSQLRTSFREIMAWFSYEESIELASRFFELCLEKSETK